MMVTWRDEVEFHVGTMLKVLIATTAMSAINCKPAAPPLPNSGPRWSVSHTNPMSILLN